MPQRTHALIEGCQRACALLNGRAAAYDRRASCSFRGKARGRPKLSPLTAFGAKTRGAKRPVFWSRPAFLLDDLNRRPAPVGALFDLYEAGLITYEDALRNADSLNDLRLEIKLHGKEARNRNVFSGLGNMDIVPEQQPNNVI